MSQAAPVHVISHPLVQRSLTILRDESTVNEIFRHHLRRAGRLMAYPLTADFELRETTVKTPLTETRGSTLARPTVLVPILRAGLGMMEGVLDVIPDATVGHVGLYRDEVTLKPKTYYENLPSHLAESEVILVDPMLATGGSSSVGVAVLKRHGATRIRFLSLVSCPAGIEAFHRLHPEVPIFTASIDEGLNDKSFILPGLGDAGDRYFGTT